MVVLAVRESQKLLLGVYSALLGDRETIEEVRWDAG